MQKFTGHTMAFFANVFFGLNFILIKLVVPAALAPFTLNIIRVGGALVLFMLLAVWLPKGFFTPVQKKHWLPLVAASLCGITINQLLFIKGLSITSATHASLLMLITPVFITLMATFFLKEKLGWKAWAGLSIALGGAVVLISGKTALVKGGSTIWLGDVMVLANAVIYSFYFILVKPLMQVYKPLQVIIMVFFVGGIAMLPFCLTSLYTTNFAAITFTQWGQISTVILLGTFGTYLLNVLSIQYIGAAATSGYIYTQPVFATLLAAWILQEQLHPYTWVASGCIFTGVFIMNRFKLAK